jgi:hypothetical protein
MITPDKTQLNTEKHPDWLYRAAGIIPSNWINLGRIIIQEMPVSTLV